MLRKCLFLFFSVTCTFLVSDPDLINKRMQQYDIGSSGSVTLFKAELNFSTRTDLIERFKGEHNHAPNAQKLRAMLEEVSVVGHMVNSCATQQLKPQHVMAKVRYSITRLMQGWAIALFGKERIALFLLIRAKKRAKEQFALFALFRSF